MQDITFAPLTPQIEESWCATYLAMQITYKNSTAELTKKLVELISPDFQITQNYSWTHPPTQGKIPTPTWSFSYTRLSALLPLLCSPRHKHNSVEEQVFWGCTKNSGTLPVVRSVLAQSPCSLLVPTASRWGWQS